MGVEVKNSGQVALGSLLRVYQAEVQVLARSCSHPEALEKDVLPGSFRWLAELSSLWFKDVRSH